MLYALFAILAVTEVLAFGGTQSLEEVSTSVKDGAYLVSVHGLTPKPNGTTIVQLPAGSVPGFAQVRVGWDQGKVETTTAIVKDGTQTPTCVYEPGVLAPEWAPKPQVELKLTQLDIDLGKKIVHVESEDEFRAEQQCKAFLEKQKTSEQRYLDYIANAGLTDKSVMITWFAGIFFGKAGIAMYVAFLLTTPVFNSNMIANEDLIYEGLLQAPDGTLECVIYANYYQIVQKQAGAFTPEQLKAGNYRWENVTASNTLMWGIKYYVDPLTETTNILIVDLPPNVVVAASGNIETSTFDPQWTCGVFCEFCQTIDNLWERQGFTSFDDCVNRYTLLQEKNRPYPKIIAEMDPLKPDGRYSLSGDTVSCRLLHQTMLQTMPSVHCHHVSFVPTKSNDRYHCVDFDWLEAQNYTAFGGRFAWERGWLLSSDEFALQSANAMAVGGPFMEYNGVIAAAGDGFNLAEMSILPLGEADGLAVQFKLVEGGDAQSLVVRIPMRLTCKEVTCDESDFTCAGVCLSQNYIVDLFTDIEEVVPGFSLNGHMPTNTSQCGDALFPVGQAQIYEIDPSCPS